MTPSCTVDTGSRNIVVQLGQVARKGFTGVGSTAGARPFNIQLNCSAGVAASNTIFLRMDATPDPSGQQGVLQVVQGAGAATGVGIQVLDGSSTGVKFGEDALVGPSKDGSYVLPFTARYYQTAPNVTAGLQLDAARDCASWQELASGVARRSSRIRLVPSTGTPATETLLQTALRPAADGSIAAELVVLQGRKRSLRRLSAPSCAEAVDALALVIAITLDPASASTPANGAEGNRTPDPLLAKQVLSQLSYRPVTSRRLRRISAKVMVGGGQRTALHLPRGHDRGNPFMRPTSWYPGISPFPLHRGSAP